MLFEQQMPSCLFYPLGKELTILVKQHNATLMKLFKNNWYMEYEQFVYLGFSYDGSWYSEGFIDMNFKVENAT